MKEIADKLSPAVTIMAFIIHIVNISVMLSGSISSLILSEIKFVIIFTVLLICSILTFGLSIRYRLRSLERHKIFPEEFKLFNSNTIFTLNQLQLYDNMNLKLEDVPKIDNIVREYVRNTLSYITTIMCTITKRKICACIKLINPPKISTKNINHFKKTENQKYKISNTSSNSLTISTYERSYNSDEERLDNDNLDLKICINENSDFEELYEANISNSTDNSKADEYYVSDLIKHKKILESIGKEYKNQTDNWDTFYKCTAVVPIKSIPIDEKDTCCIIGFLCIDSLTKNALRKSEKRYNCDLLHAFAYNLFLVFDLYSKLLKSVPSQPQQKVAVTSIPIST